MGDEIRNTAYLNILNDVLKKKAGVLEALAEETEKQAQLIKEENFNLDAFNETIDAKAALLEKLAALDEGFLELYEKAKKDITENPGEYKEELTETKRLIGYITECAAGLEAAEERNRTGLEIQLSKGKQKVKDFKVSSRTAAAYYKNMSNRHKEGDSYFIDRKK